MSFRISAKNLGYLLLPDYCPRCFWIKAKMGFKTPFSIFPGIFSSLDAYQKRITNFHFDKHGSVPEWFWAKGEPIPVPHHSHFQFNDPETDILLTGVPDEILRMEDATLAIYDYKTAKFTGNQDSLMPIYVAQLNGYALIAEHIGLGTVSRLGLLYYEPQTDITEDDIDSLVQPQGYKMDFQAKGLAVEKELSLIPPLLQKARSIYDMPEPPQAKEGCKDCRLVDEMVGLLR